MAKNEHLGMPAKFQGTRNGSVGRRHKANNTHDLKFPCLFLMDDFILLKNWSGRTGKYNSKWNFQDFSSFYSAFYASPQFFSSKMIIFSSTEEKCISVLGFEMLFYFSKFYTSIFVLYLIRVPLFLRFLLSFSIWMYTQITHKTREKNKKKNQNKCELHSLPKNELVSMELVWKPLFLVSLKRKKSTKKNCRKEVHWKNLKETLGT